MLPASNVLSWDARTVRYAASLTGTNPVADLDLTGPLGAVERILPLFLDLPDAAAPAPSLRGARGRFARRLTARLEPLTDVEQLEDGGLSIGRATGPYGYIAPPLDPDARVDDHTPVSAALHGIGVDYLITTAPHLAR